MTDEQQYEDEPNEAGFAGDPTTPEPEPEPKGEHPFGEVDGESIAVPGGDLTEGLTEALEGLSDSDEK
jgi:hypothetical protein